MNKTLEINNLFVEYHTILGTANALNGVDLVIHNREALGLVGETGAGKTTTALSILRLLPPRTSTITRGSILFRNKDLLKEQLKSMRGIRGQKISMIFQNPLTSLNPVFTVGEQIGMVFQQHQKLTPKACTEKVGKMLELVGIPAYRQKEYPHEFSGGMRQRVGIAAALAQNPELLIADEPTTALDVTIQAQVLSLMKDLQVQYGTSLLLITHNLAIVAEMCETIAVMYGGQIFEYGSVKDVFLHPSHPYTQGLIASIPDLNSKKERLKPIPGNVPNALHLPTGCKFHPRCPFKMEKCCVEEPESIHINSHHTAKCFLL